MTAAPLLVYVHFPWCLEKCPYCDFVSYARPRDEIDHEGYADAVIAELAARAPALAGEHALHSVFLGGGTPSLWEPEQVARVLAAIRSRFSGDDVEVTAECNPSSLDEPRARALLDAGVNRLSVGVQALDDARLSFLGRLHDANGARTALLSARRAGAARLSGDLIFGVHDEPPEVARDEAVALAELGLTHLSAYALTIEPGTRFGEQARRGRLPLADDGRVAESFLEIDRALTARGFEHYETSNYATPGEASRHNLGYWRGHAYLGLGCAAVGAVSTQGGFVRYKNPISPDKYRDFARRRAPDAELAAREPLDGETRLRERIMLGLRLAEGLDLAAAGEALGVVGWTSERLRVADKLVARGRLERDGATVRVPRSSWLFADGVAAELF
ncbi:MAG: radical SAM family heme chaperone HemW [Polyangiaceae bacterium]|nr:radical SAM family heme chaperone HemW [Polyangiaceae bacterium]